MRLKIKRKLAQLKINRSLVRLKIKRTLARFKIKRSLVRLKIKRMLARLKNKRTLARVKIKKKEKNWLPNSRLEALNPDNLQLTMTSLWNKMYKKTNVNQKKVKITNLLLLRLKVKMTNLLLLLKASMLNAPRIATLRATLKGAYGSGQTVNVMTRCATTASSWTTAAARSVSWIRSSGRARMGALAALVVASIEIDLIKNELTKFLTTWDDVYFAQFLHYLFG